MPPSAVQRPPTTLQVSPSIVLNLPVQSQYHPVLSRSSCDTPSALQPCLEMPSRQWEDAGGLWTALGVTGSLLSSSRQHWERTGGIWAALGGTGRVLLPLVFYLHVLLIMCHCLAIAAVPAGGLTSHATVCLLTCCPTRIPQPADGETSKKKKKRTTPKLTPPQQPSFHVDSLHGILQKTPQPTGQASHLTATCYFMIFVLFYVIFTCFCAQQDPEGAAGLGLLSPEGLKQLPAPVPQPYSITPRARGKCLFSPPDLGGRQVKLQTDRAAATEFLESACPKTRVPAVWHSWQTNWDRAGARMAGQGWRCARWRGLPTFGSTELVRKQEQAIFMGCSQQLLLDAEQTSKPPPQSTRART